MGLITEDERYEQAITIWRDTTENAGCQKTASREGPPAHGDTAVVYIMARDARGRQG